jgi:hypothetical protein
MKELATLRRRGAAARTPPSDSTGSPRRESNPALAALARGGILLAALAGLGLLGAFLAPALGSGGEGGAFNADFPTLWAAGRLAVTGETAALFDGQAYRDLLGGIYSGRIPWLYPPGTLAVVAPLGLLPVGHAWAALVLTSFLAWWAALGAAVRRPAIVLAAGVCPLAFLPVAISGNLTILWAAGLLGALAALERGRPALAGILIGLLTIKPQLGLLLPVALLAAGAWRAIAAAAVTALALAALTTLMTGAAYWRDLAGAVATRHGAYADGTGETALMIGPAPLLLGLGVDGGTALLLHWCVAAALAILVAILWQSPRACADARAAVLFAATPLAAPFLWHYDAALLAVAAVLLMRTSLVRSPAAAGMVGLVWLAPLPAVLFRDVLPLAWTIVPLGLGTVALALVAARSGAGGRRS